MKWYYILSMKNTIVSHKYCLLIDKALTTNEKDIVNHFNTIFKSVTQKLVKKVPPTHNNFKNHWKTKMKRPSSLDQKISKKQTI